jgi:hypothetical protein
MPQRQTEGLGVPTGRVSGGRGGAGSGAGLLDVAADAGRGGGTPPPPDTERVARRDPDAGRAGAGPVRATTVASGWKRSHDPDLDFAVLTLAKAGGKRIQARTGGLTIGFTRWHSEKIEAIGHNDTDAEPIRCATKSFRFRTGQMEFYCHGFWTGTSGGPWIIGYNARNGTGIGHGSPNGRGGIGGRVPIADHAGPDWLDQHRLPGSGAPPSRLARPQRGGITPVSYAIDLERDLSVTPSTSRIGVGGVGDRSGILSVA